MTEKLPVTVTALTKYIKAKFQADRNLQNILLRGEISNFKRHSSSGHYYFTLKDDGARIAAVMFQSYNSTISFQPTDGMQVIVQGEITVYPGSGSYQIYIRDMQPDGVGGLFVAYEQLKKKLSEEGLFDQKFKKKIPSFPSVIGVATSPTGAAVRDIITTIQRRYPIGKIVVFPTLVQGEQAPMSVVKSIETANTLKEIDVLIIGRGGGSIEELWAFNDEKVARAIFESKIPIISAVGHETDTTIADYVADLRAPTPTAAAELVSLSQREIIEQFTVREARLNKTMNTILERKQAQLKTVQDAYVFRYPNSLLNPKQEEFDRTYEKLQMSMNEIIKSNSNKYKELSSTLLIHHPRNRVQLEKQKHHQLYLTLQSEFKRLLTQRQFEMEKAIHTLDALSPLKVMARGYSLAYKEDNELVKSVKQVKDGDRFQLQMTDGKLNCEVLEVKEQ
ncbi:exodeoxyribonuclease VII large subunit [Bacillus sp. EAC]|uniref:exodeoxyribonuclease VII large subunit n=1 Tax=Bacillus sp. EAC TaxID=1978338 RepID=UPI000B436D60|nr:exodeoxyribonuclease VII large subunit [Bacillus sp. EAC]